MLQFLQTGKVLYVLACICGLGIISKLVTRNLYKRLTKETGNMALTKNKNLRAFKQKTENVFLLSHGIRNVNAYIEKQIYGFRFIGMSLDSWNNLSVQAMILCFLIGGLGAFGAYWYRCDSYYIVLYGTMGILSGLSLVFVDNSVNISLRRQQLVDTLIDYVENSPHFYRSVDKSSELMENDRKESSLAAASKNRLREMGRTNLRAIGEIAASDGMVQEVGKLEKRNGKENTGKTNGRLSVLSRKKEQKEPTVLQTSMNRTNKGRAKEKECVSEIRNVDVEEEELLKSIDYLKQSLEQIAASREEMRNRVKSADTTDHAGMESMKKELRPEDIQLIGEMLQEYLT